MDRATRGFTFTDRSVFVIFAGYGRGDGSVRSSPREHASPLRISDVLFRVFARLVLQAHVVTALLPLVALVVTVAQFRWPLVSSGTMRP